MPSHPALRWQVLGLCLVLAAITFAVFGQTTGFEFVNYDDEGYVYANAKVASGLSLKGLAWVFTHADCSLYHPLTMLSLMADYQLHGLHAGGYHLTNVLLHTASVILLFLVLRQMTGALWRSAFVAAVFAIHPLRVESVAWVAERKDVLSTFFFMLTLGAYARYVRQPNSLVRYLMVAAAFVLALLSKPTVVTLPFVLLLLDYWPLQRKESAKRLILEKIPLLALAVVACALTVLAAKKGITPNADITMLSRLGHVVVSYAIYLRQMVWPVDLAVFYPMPEKGYAFWTIAPSILLLALITGGVWAFRRKHRWLLTGWFWYLGMLTPMIGIVQVGSFAHADRMTYLPQIGLYLLLTWAVAEWRVNRVALGSLMTAVLAALMACAWKQTAYWRDDKSLYEHTLKITSGNYIAHNNLGYMLLETGKLDEAVKQFQEVIRLKPFEALPHYSLGRAYMRKGKMAEAIVELKTALRLKPDDIETQTKLAEALIKSGKAADAIPYCESMVATEPGDAHAHFTLGLACLAGKRVEEAMANYKEAVRLAPDAPQCLNALAWVYATYPKAEIRNGAEAMRLAGKACQITKRQDMEMLDTLAAAYAETGRFDEAIKTTEEIRTMAVAAHDTAITDRAQHRLELYKAGKPYRDEQYL